MTEGWFGPWTYNEGEAEGSPFLETVRSLALQKLAGLIEPEDTVVSSYPVAPFVLLTVDVAISEEPSSIGIDMLYAAGASSLHIGEETRNALNR